MATSLTTGSIQVDFKGYVTDAQDDGTNVKDEARRNLTKSYTDGTGSGKAQLCYHEKRSLLTTTDETLDLTALDGTFGTYAFSEVKAILIEVETASTGYRLEVGAAAENQWAGANQPIKDPSDIIRVGASGRWLHEAAVDGFAVDATHKNLKISNPSGGTVAYRIIVLGEGTVS